MHEPNNSSEKCSKTPNLNLPSGSKDFGLPTNHTFHCQWHRLLCHISALLSNHTLANFCQHGGDPAEQSYSQSHTKISLFWFRTATLRSSPFQSYMVFGLWSPVWNFIEISQCECHCSSRILNDSEKKTSHSSFWPTKCYLSRIHFCSDSMRLFGTKMRAICKLKLPERCPI